MARSRTIKPGFFTNEELASCSPLARLCFAGCWTLADREGKLEDRPKRIKAQLFPYDDCDGESLLSELAAAGFIERYEVDDSKVIRITNFAKNQSPHPQEKAAGLPDKPSNNTASNLQDTAEPVKEIASCALTLPSSSLVSIPSSNPSTQAPASAGDPPAELGAVVRPEMIPLPTNLDVPYFRDTWARWLEHQRQKGNRPSQLTITSQLENLSRWGPELGCKAINHSIEHGYTGLFDPQTKSGQKAKPAKVHLQ